MAVILKRSPVDSRTTTPSSPTFISRVNSSLSSSIVTVRDVQPLALVSPVKLTAPSRSAVTIVTGSSITPQKLSEVLAAKFPRPSGLFSLDLETKGVNPLLPENRIVGVGLANHESILYIDFERINPSCYPVVWNFISNPAIDFVGHNVMFDSSWLVHPMGGFAVNWRYDTYALFRQLCNEGYPTQRYGLKDAQVDLLGWDSKGDVELSDWLVEAGYKNSQGNPLKGEMWRAPAEILGYYCGLDVASTYQLATDVFFPAIGRYSWANTFNWYHQLFMKNLQALIEQRLDGIKIDKEQFDNYYEWIGKKTDESYNNFIQNPSIAPLVTRFNQTKVQEIKEKEPAQFKKNTLGKEPPRYKKNSDEERSDWIKWCEKKNRPPEITKTWLNWSEKYNKAHETNFFNLNSTNTREWLFYDQLGFEPILFTETGRPATDKRALKGWGEYGQLLKTYNDLVKEQQMATSCLNALIDWPGDSFRIHPEFKAPGTFTCRLAGSGGFNIQQIPKRKEYLSCWVPDPGQAWVDCDHAALEPVVLAALSGDETMWKLYGPGAVANDIYLFNGAYLPGIGEKIRAAGYDPDRPTKEGIAAAKASCKKERSISKIITLGSQYGMGPKKIQMTLKLESISVSLEEAEAMHRSYWSLYRGIKTYEAKLVREWRQNDGWVLNGIGRPVCCSQDLLKDIVNRVVQSTGHDIHMMFIEALLELRETAGFPVSGIIWDFHDQTIVQVPEEYGASMIQVYRAAYRQTNKRLRELNPDFALTIKGEPAIVKNLANAKISEE